MKAQGGTSSGAMFASTEKVNQAMALARKILHQEAETILTLAEGLDAAFWTCVQLISTGKGLVWVTGVGTSAAVAQLKDKYELIGDVRGPGLMIGIELVRDKKTKEPAREESYQFEKESLKRGILFGTAKYAGISRSNFARPGSPDPGQRRGFGNPLRAILDPLGMGNVVKIKPPLVITDAQAERVMDVFEEVAQLLSL